MNSQASPSKPAVRIFTIGFAGKSAQEFFESLQAAGVRRVVDVRLSNVSQMAAFTKKRDLEYFLRTIADIDYAHLDQFAPSKELLEGYRSGGVDWQEYQRRFDQLLEQRKPELGLEPDDFDGACIMCSEKGAEECHRRLVAEYLQRRWNSVVVEHL